MVANLQVSNNISSSLSYGQNLEKGGEIFLCNYTDITASTQEQIKDWEAMSNNYRNKCYNIVISFSDKDTEKIRQIEDINKRVKFERLIIKSFMDELTARGNNVYDCPFIVAHHGNTDNEHFHICILNTTIYGKHIRDSFFKKNACRSAAKVSEKYGLEAAPSALANERRHQKAVGERTKREEDKNTKRKYTKVQKESDKLSYRAERVRLANKRKAKCKFIIESIATDRQTTEENFISKLSDAGLELHHDDKFGFFIIMRDEEDENKKYSYLLKKHLNVDSSILPDVDAESISMPWKQNKAPSKECSPNLVKPIIQQQVSNKNQQTPTSSNSISTVKVLRSFSKPLKDGHQTMQGDINPDGSSNHNDDDLDDQWKKRNGYHY